MTDLIAPSLRLAGIALLLSACSKELPAPKPSPALVACSVSEGQPNLAALQAAKDLRAQIEKGPLYQTAAAQSTLTACAWRFPEGGALAQEYSFRNGSRLQVQSDAGIEYSNQSLSLAEPPAEPPEALLKQAERASFGEQGCGIDWQTPPEQAQPSATAEAGTASESVFRGKSCNCQARVRRNAAGRAVGLMMRSAC